MGNSFTSGAYMITDAAREQFLLDRKTGIGGSDIAAIMGLNPWRSALDVYNDKISTTIELIDSPQLSRGRKLEKYILEEYTDHTGQELEVDLPMMRDKEYPFLIGHSDAKIKDKNILVEAKSVGSSSSLWQNIIPPYYKTQVAHYAAIADCEFVDVPVLFDRWEYAQYTYYRDESYEKTLRTAAIDFWHNHVLKQVPPEPQNMDGLKKLYPRANAKAIQADDSLKTAIADLNKLVMDQKTVDMKINNVKSHIMRCMEDNETIEDEHGKSMILWRNSTRKVFDLNGFKESNPELHEQYVKNTVCRMFRTC